MGPLLAVISICLTLFLLEIATRLLPPPYNYEDASLDVHALNYLTCNPTLGWTGAPNFQGVIESPVFRQEVNFNSAGMNDSEHTTEKAPHTFRILILGDSFVEGFQVDETATAHQVLEDYLNEQDQGSTRFEVLSSGVLGWGTGQQLVYYQAHGRNFQPDLVVLMFFIGNDVQNNLPGNTATVSGINCSAPYFAWCNDQLNPDALTYVPGLSNHLQNNCTGGRRAAIKTMGFLYQHSRLYQQIDPFIVANNPRPTFGAGYLSPLYALYLPNDDTKLEYAWQVTLGTIAQLQQEVAADGGQLAIAIISPEEIFRLKTLPPPMREQFLQQNPHLADVQLDRPYQRLDEFFQTQNIPHIDLITPMLEKQMANDITLHIEGDRHWTVEGNRVVAEILAQWFAQKGLVSP